MREVQRASCVRRHRDFPAEISERSGIEHALSGQALLHSGIAGRRRRENDFGFSIRRMLSGSSAATPQAESSGELGKEKVFPAAALNLARLIEIRTEFGKSG